LSFPYYCLLKFDFIFNYGTNLKCGSYRKVTDRKDWKINNLNVLLSNSRFDSILMKDGV